MLLAASFLAGNFAGGGHSFGSEAAEEAGVESSPVSYFKQVRPLFQKRCQGCHQPAKAGGKFVITAFTELMNGGRTDDPIIVPGKPEESLLFQEITPEDGEPPRMPKKAEPLGTVEVELVRRWIIEGAKDDTPAAAKDRVIDDENPPLYQSPPVLSSVDYSPDGSLLAVSGYHEVLLYKADGSSRVGRLIGLSERIESAIFSPDGKYLAVAGGMPARMGEVQVWDVEKRSLRVSVPVTFDTLYGASWSSDGRLVAFGCADNSLRAIEADTGRQVLFQGAHGDWVLDTAFSKDNSHLVSVSRDRSLKLVKVKTQQFIDNITSITPGALKGGLIAVDRHPTRDELLVGGADGTPKIYRMFRERRRIIGDDYNMLAKCDPMPGRIFAAVFRRDGTRIACGSSYNGTGEVRVYVLTEGSKEKAAEGTENLDQSTKNEETTETKESKLLWALKADEAIYTVAFSPDGKTVATGGFAGVVKLLDGETGEQKSQFTPVPLSF